MGSSSSKVHESDASASTTNAKRSVMDVVKIMLPVYYCGDPITEADIALAKAKWDLIIDDRSLFFNSMKGTPGYEASSCMGCFYDRFYSRLFDIHPACRPMFRSGLKSQGKFLVKMMTMTLQLAIHEQKFLEAMLKLADIHNKRGVKAIEYGIVGEVLFYTLKSCLGPEYDSATHKVWVKIFSRMLMIIVPVAVTFEMQSGNAQMERLRAATVAEKDKINMFSTDDTSSDLHGDKTKTGDHNSVANSVAGSRVQTAVH